MRLRDNKELCTLWKVVFGYLMAQSFTEKGFSINKEVVDDNMKGKSLIFQQILYDTI